MSMTDKENTYLEVGDYAKYVNEEHPVSIHYGEIGKVLGNWDQVAGALIIQLSDGATYYPQRYNLEYCTQPEKDIETMVEEFDNKPITKREYLLKLVAKMEANKKEFNETVDKQIEKLNKEMTCGGCYIQADGQYNIQDHKIYPITAIEVADFIKDMETKMVDE